MTHTIKYTVLKPDLHPTTMCRLEKTGDFFILTLAGDDDHRFSPTLINCLLLALSQAKSQATRGSVLITTSEGKFFSNGFDLAWAQAAGYESATRDRIHHMVDIFKPVISALMSLPMPTIAAVSGHAAAAGSLLALSHDYILMRRDRGMINMCEVDLDLTLPDYFVAMMRSKIGSASSRRDVLLRGMKAKMGIVESTHDDEGSVMDAATALGEELAKRKWEGEVYTEIRKSLYPEVCFVLGLGLPGKAISSSKL